MDKRIREILKTNGKVTSGMRGQVQLTPIFSQLVWEGKREKERERGRKEESLERGSTFSLDFPVIGLSNSVEEREKVDPHCKSYA